MSAPSLAVLHNLATQLRIDSVPSTTEAGSGHPTTCLSAAEIVAALFFAEMRFDPHDPQHPEADRFVLSKGHGAPILYAAWAEAGSFPRDGAAEPAQDRRPTSKGTRRRGCRSSTSRPDRSGRVSRAGVGIALNARRIDSDYRTYVLLGDGETRGRIGLGSGGSRREPEARQPLRDHRRQRPRPEPRDAVGPPSDGVHVALERVRLARHRDRRPRPRRDPRARSTKPATTKGRPTMIVAGTVKGKGVLDLRGQGRLARQGAQEGRRDRPGDRRARSADT